jgi:hypothetical protein
LEPSCSICFAAEAYLERLRAEATALDMTNRLRVAQEQLLEYAKQKESDADEMLQQATLVAEAAAQASPELVASMTALKDRLVEAAAEARAFAAQQKQDVETLKRSSQQVCCMELERARRRPIEHGLHGRDLALHQLSCP